MSVNPLKSDTLLRCVPDLARLRHMNVAVAAEVKMAPVRVAAGEEREHTQHAGPG